MRAATRADVMALALCSRMSSDSSRVVSGLRNRIRCRADKDGNILVVGNADISGKILENSKSRTSVYYRIADPDGAGRGILPHWHEQEETITLLSGSHAVVSWTEGGVRISRTIIPGKTITIPPRSPHDVWYFGGCVAIVSHKPGMRLQITTDSNREISA